MRKLFLVSSTAALALILAHQPVAATTVTDYTNFTNSSTEHLSLTGYTPGSGETVGYTGATSVNAGGTSLGYYTATAQTPSSITIVWTADLDGTTCTFNFNTSSMDSETGNATPTYQAREQELLTPYLPRFTRSSAIIRSPAPALHRDTL
jgi:hypothetical protein